MSDWKKYVHEGFPVIWATSPGSTDEFSATVVKVDDETIDALVWSSQGGSAIAGSPRHGLRHIGDPIWSDAERTSNIVGDNDSGSFKPHPLIVSLVDGVEALKAGAEDAALIREATDGEVIELPPAKKNRKKVEQGPPSPAAFRTDALPELTDEQKKQREEALAAAGV